MSGFNSSNGIDLVFSPPVLIFLNTLCPTIIDTDKNTWCVEQINQATNTKWITIITASKKINNSKREVKKKNTREFVYLVRSNTDLVWGREQLSVPL